MEFTNFENSVKKGLAWRTIVDVSQIILQILFTAILARLLTKSDFGLVAMSLLFTTFIRVFTQIGFGSAIIQDHKVNNETITAIFLIQVGVNLALSILCFFAAPIAAYFFQELQLIPVIKTIAWIFLINSFSFPQILLRKKMYFKGYSLLELFSMVSGNIIGIILALYGFGVWALVYKLITQSIIFSIGVWPISRWQPSRPSFSGINKLVEYGLHMLGSNIFNYFSQNMSSIIIGKFIGVETLGLFNIAYNLAIIPAQKIQTILTTVLTPGFSKIQGNLEEFREKFYLSLFTLGFIFFPAMFGISATSQNLIVVLYGDKWSEAGIFLKFLALIGLFKGIEHLLRAVILAKGWSRAIFLTTVIETFISLPLLFYSIYYFGIKGLLSAYLLSSIIAFCISLLIAQKAVNDQKIFINAAFKSLIISFFMFCLVFVPFMVTNFSVPITLVLQIITGIIFYSLIRYLFLTDYEITYISKWPILCHLVNSKKTL